MRNRHSQNSEKQVIDHSTGDKIKTMILFGCVEA